MAKMRRIGLALVGLMTFAALAPADFDGPAPLAWRWVQPTTVSPGGAPIVEGNTIYVAVGQRMFSIDKETGNQKWKFPPVEPIQGYFRSGVLLHEGVLVAAGDNKTLYAVDPATGAPMWQYLAPSAIVGTPVGVGKYIVFAMTDNSLQAIDAATGNPAWSAPYKTFSSVLGSMTKVGGVLVFVNSNGELVGLDVATQKTAYRQKLSQTSPDSAPVAFGEMLYMTTGSYLICVNGVTGAGRWQRNVGSPLIFGPSVSAEGISVATQEGTILMFDIDGKPKFKNALDIGSMPIAKATPVGKMYVQNTANGAVNLLDGTTGEVLWSYLIRPLPGTAGQPTGGSAGGGAAGGGIGGPGGLGGPGGGGPGGGFGGGAGFGGGFGGGQGGRPGGGGGGTTSTTASQVFAIPAAGPAVVSGNTLLVLARDGSMLAFDRELGVDLTPPKVTMLWPTPGDVGGSQPSMEIIFRVEDEATGINTKSLKIDVDGTDLKYEFGRDGLAVIRISSEGANKPFTNGRRVVTVAVADWLGNESKSSFSFTVDNALKAFSRPTGTGTQGLGGPGGGGGGKGGAGGAGGSGR